MNKLVILLLVTVLFGTNVSADMLTVYNKTNDIVYCAPYKKPRLGSQAAKLQSNIVAIAPNSVGSVERPDSGFFERMSSNRRLYCTRSFDVLKASLSYDEASNLMYIPIGTTDGSMFYITLNEGGVLVGSNVFQRKIVDPIAEKGKDLYKTVITATAYTWLKVRGYSTKYSPFAKESAHVRSLPDGIFRQGQQEKDFIVKRFVTTKKAIEKLLHTSLQNDEVPSVALCFTGGGMRAATGTLGSLRGAEKIGLLDAVSYVATLSGSTWALSAWVHSILPLSEVSDKLLNRFQDNFEELRKTVESTPRFVDLIAKKIISKEDYTPFIDFYGVYLSNKFLKNLTPLLEKVDQVGLHEQTVALEQYPDRYPFPIYTSLIDHTLIAGDQYALMEYTPYEIITNYGRGAVVSWALGRKFSGGMSTNNVFPMTTGFMMGVWGSAMSLSLKDVFKHVGFTLMPAEQLPEIAHMRFIGASYPNFLVNLPGSPLGERSDLTVADAGHDCNMPVSPLLHKDRHIDIMVLFSYQCNQTSDVALFKHVEQIARNMGVTFPVMDYRRASTDICTAFYPREGVNAPVVIIIPLVNYAVYSTTFDPIKEMSLGRYMNTLNFSYTPQQAKQLAGLTERIVMDSKHTFEEALRYVVDRKRKGAQALAAPSQVVSFAGSTVAASRIKSVN